MSRDPPTDDPHQSTECRPSRRQVLAGAAGVASTASAGCVGWVEAALDDGAPAQVTLGIKTVPADTDRRSIRIARYLAKRLAVVGVDARVQPMSLEELRRDVLLNHEFDLYVGRHPGRLDPDYLRSMLHSRFGPEAGWQNPFGYADLDMDDLLAVQRRQHGAARTVTLRNIQSSIVNNQPFSVVAFPTDIRVCRSERLIGWDAHGVHSPLGYLSLDHIPGALSPDDTATATATETPPGAPGSDTRSPTPTEHGTTSEAGGVPAERSGTATGTDGPGNESGGSTIAERADQGEVRMGTIDARMTRNLNPIAAAFRQGGTITGMLYDPLGREFGGRIRPWLAEDWEWTDQSGATLSARVSLREDLSWHDGTDLTADDVAFTHRFLQDTSLGGLETATPATRFRGRSSLVEGVRVVDERTAELSFGGCSRPVALWSLTVPILPEHVWRSRTEPRDPGWLTESAAVTEALVWPNPNPVGSGPFRFEGWARDGHLSLVPYQEHFLRRDGLDAIYGGFGTDSIERLRFEVVPSTRSAVALAVDGDLDGTASPVRPSEVPTDLPTGLQRFEASPTAFYHVGFNTRRSPLSNPRFRRAVARLLDKEYLVETAFEGYARPAASPLARHDALSPRLEWDGRDPELPFPGEDGDLNPSRARAPFRRAGYRYGEDGALLVR